MGRIHSMARFDEEEIEAEENVCDGCGEDIHRTSYIKYEGESYCNEGCLLQVIDFTYVED